MGGGSRTLEISHRMIERNKLPNAIRLAESCVQMFPMFANYHIPKRL